MTLREAENIVRHMNEWHLHHEGLTKAPSDPIRYSLRTMMTAATYLNGANESRKKRSMGGRRAISLYVVPDDVIIAGLYMASRVEGKDPNVERVTTLTGCNGSVAIVFKSPDMSGQETTLPGDLTDEEMNEAVDRVHGLRRL